MPQVQPLHGAAGGSEAFAIISGQTFLTPQTLTFSTKMRAVVPLRAATCRYVPLGCVGAIATALMSCEIAVITWAVA